MQQTIEIQKYVNVVLRRKYLIVISCMVIVLVGLAYGMITPPIYEAKTLILVEPQKVPENVVRPILQSDIEERLRTLSLQVTSRTNLESIIHGYALYDDSKGFMEGKIRLFRKMIKIDVARSGRGGDAFEITFRDRDPGKTMKVANALASNFISQNLKIRESWALGTSNFLAEELESIRRRLVEKEEQLKKYRAKYMGAMPEHLQTNLTVLGRLQEQLKDLNTSLRDAENRRVIVQRQIADMEMMQSDLDLALGNDLSLSGRHDSEFGIGEPAELASLRKQFASLKLRYTEKHPDVRRLKEMIDKLEKEKEESRKREEKEPAHIKPKVQPTASSGVDFLKPQLQQIEREIGGLKAEIKIVRSDVEIYRLRVQETPKREQELISLNRDYGNLKNAYDSLVRRKLEADISVSMERKQKGEQFRVIDPAKVPTRPVKPELLRILLISLVLGLGLGGGLTYLVEVMDTSYKSPDEVEKELKVPVLVSMPIRYTEQETRKRRAKEVLKGASVAVGFVLSAAGIVIAAKGVDKTLDYVRSILDKI